MLCVVLQPNRQSPKWTNSTSNRWLKFPSFQDHLGEKQADLLSSFLISKHWILINLNSFSHNKAPLGGDKQSESTLAVQLAERLGVSPLSTISVWGFKRQQVKGCLN